MVLVKKEVSKVYVGDPEDNTKYIQIRPNLPKTKIVDILVVGGGGSGGCGSGGGAGAFIECCGYELKYLTNNIVVGCGQTSYNTCNRIGRNGCGSAFSDIYALGGGGGGGGETYNSHGYDGGNGGGAYAYGTCGGCGLQGYNGQSCTQGCGGGGAGGCGTTSCPGEYVCSCMSGELCYYSGGGRGGGQTAHSVTGCGFGGNAGYGAGKNGVVIVRYKQNGSYGIHDATGGTITCCDGYKIHIFTCDDNFIVND